MLCSWMVETYLHIWRSVTGAVRKTHSSDLDKLWPFLAYTPEFKNSQHLLIDLAALCKTFERVPEFLFLIQSSV